MAKKGGPCKACKFCVHNDWYCTIYGKHVKPDGPLEFCHAMRPE